MKEEKFKVIQFARELILKIDLELENFPKKDIDIKIRIRNESYDLLESDFRRKNYAKKYEIYRKAKGGKWKKAKTTTARKWTNKKHKSNESKHNL